MYSEKVQVLLVTEEDLKPLEAHPQFCDRLDNGNASHSRDIHVVACILTTLFVSIVMMMAVAYSGTIWWSDVNGLSACKG